MVYLRRRGLLEEEGFRGDFAVIDEGETCESEGSARASEAEFAADAFAEGLPEVSLGELELEALEDEGTLFSEEGPLAVRGARQKAAAAISAAERARERSSSQVRGRVSLLLGQRFCDGCWRSRFLTEGSDVCAERALCFSRRAVCAQRELADEDGSVYWGEFDASGLPHGLGTRLFPDGNSYSGMWVAGKKHGLGVFAFPDGESYSGEYRTGRMEGRGVYAYANGDL